MQMPSPTHSRTREDDPLLQDTEKDQSSSPRSVVGELRGSISTVANSNGSGNGHFDSILQFSSPLYYLDEAEGIASIDVMRLGSMEGRVSARFASADGSAVAGVKYAAVAGNLTFESWEHSKTFEVRVIKRTSWTPTQEFRVALSDPEGCQLGDYLQECRVKVINNDPFLDESFAHSTIQNVVGFRLWWIYFRLNLVQYGMLWRTLLVLLLDQLHNAYVCFRIGTMIYLVDVVLNTADTESCDDCGLLIPGDRSRTATLIGLVYGLSSILLHLWDIGKVHLGLVGLSEEFLQESLVHKYLNYSENSRHEVKSSDMLVALTEDCMEVAESYVIALDAVTMSIKVVILVAFIAITNPASLPIVVAMPPLMICFAAHRRKVQEAASTKTRDTEVSMLAWTEEMCGNFRLIADYMQRPLMNHNFSTKAMALRSANMLEKVVDTNNQYFPAWICCIFVGVYIWSYSHLVFENKTSLGTFLATIGVLHEVSETLSMIYKLFVKIIGSFESLGGVALLLNMQTELKARHKVLQQSRSLLDEVRAHILGTKKASSESGSHGEITQTSGCSTAGGWLVDAVNRDLPHMTNAHFITDHIPITMRGVSFRYSSVSDHDHSRAILDNVNLEIKLGSFVAVLAPHGTGRATLLRLIGQVLPPTEGHVFVPPHLRVLHVTQEPVLLGMSLWVNLTFGVASSGKEANVSGPLFERVCTILRRLHMQRVLRFVTEETKGMSTDGEPRPGGRISLNHHREMFSLAARGIQDADIARRGEGFLWQSSLSDIERAKVHLARALIMDPEVCVMQRPLSIYSHREAARVLTVLKEHVDHRGLGLPEALRENRRPRTLLFSPEDEGQAAQADVLMKVEPQDKGSSKVHVITDRTQFADVLLEQQSAPSRGSSCAMPRRVPSQSSLAPPTRNSSRVVTR